MSRPGRSRIESRCNDLVDKTREWVITLIPRQNPTRPLHLASELRGFTLDLEIIRG